MKKSTLLFTTTLIAAAAGTLCAETEDSFTWSGGNITAEEWAKSSNWTCNGDVPFPTGGNGPETPNSDAWASINISGASGTTPTLEGWELKLALTNGSNLTINGLKKFQTDNGGGNCSLYIDGTSTLTINNFGVDNGNDGNAIDLENYGTFNMQYNKNQGGSGFNMTLGKTGYVSFTSYDATNHTAKVASVDAILADSGDHVSFAGVTADGYKIVSRELIKLDSNISFDSETSLNIDLTGDYGVSLLNKDTLDDLDTGAAGSYYVSKTDSGLSVYYVLNSSANRFLITNEAGIWNNNSLAGTTWTNSIDGARNHAAMDLSTDATITVEGGSNITTDGIFVLGTGNLTLAGETISLSGNQEKLQAFTGTSLTIGNQINVNSDLTTKGDVAINGKLNFNENSNVSLSSGTTFGADSTIDIASGKTVTLASGTMVWKNANNNSGLLVVGAGATLDLGSQSGDVEAITVSGVSGTGIVKIESARNDHGGKVVLSNGFTGTIDFTGRFNPTKFSDSNATKFILSQNSSSEGSMWGGNCSFAKDILFKTDYQVGDSNNTSISLTGNIEIADGKTVSIYANTSNSKTTTLTISGTVSGTGSFNIGTDGTLVIASNAHSIEVANSITGTGMIKITGGGTGNDLSITGALINVSGISYTDEGGQRINGNINLGSESTNATITNDVVALVGNESNKTVTLAGTWNIGGNLRHDRDNKGILSIADNANVTVGGYIGYSEISGNQHTFNLNIGSGASLQVGNLNSSDKLNLILDNNAKLSVTGAMSVNSKWGEKTSEIKLKDGATTATVEVEKIVLGYTEGEQRKTNFEVSGVKLNLGEGGLVKEEKFNGDVTFDNVTLGGKDNASFEVQTALKLKNTFKIDAGIETQTITFNDAISGEGSLTKTGAGTLVLSGDNIYSGGTTISKGTLKITNANALGTGTVTIGEGTLSLGVASMTVQNLAYEAGKVGALSTSIGSATLTVDGECSFFGFINNGVSLVASNITGGQITLCSGATLKFTGTNAAENIDVSAGAKLIANTATVGKITVSENAQIQLTKTVTSGTITLGTGAKILISGSSLEGYERLDPAEDNVLKIIATSAISNMSPLSLYSVMALDVQSNSITEHFQVDPALGSYTLGVADGWVVLSIPEPSAFGLLAGLGALALAGTRRRRKVK